MRGRTKYGPKPLVADPLWAISQGPPGVPGAPGPASMIPGPVGPQGERGADAKGWTFRGEWKRTATYQEGDVVSDDGSTYLALEPSKGKSPPGKQWALIAAKGLDGLDGISQRGPRGRDGTTTVVSSEGSPTAAIFDTATAKGMPVFVSGDGHVDLALADTLATAAVIGLAASDVGEGFAGLVETDRVELDDWSSVLGSEFLTPGLSAYLALGGGLSHSAPEPAAGVCITLIGRALNATTLIVEIADPVVLVDPPE